MILPSKLQTLKALVSLVVVILSALGVSAQQYYGRVQDKDGYTNIRRGPGTNYVIERTYRSGDHLYYTPQGNGWSKVYSSNKSSTFMGYMATNRIVKVQSPDEYATKPITLDNYPWLKQYKRAEYIGDGCFALEDKENVNAKEEKIISLDDDDLNLNFHWIFEDKKIVNAKGEKIISLDKDEQYFHFHNGKIIVLDDYDDVTTWEIMVYDTKGKEQIPEGYFVEWYSYYEDGEPLLSEGVVVKKDGKYGLLNDSGIAIPCIYDSICYHSNDQLLAKKDGEWMAVDAEGKTKPIPQMYDYRFSFSFDTGIAIVNNKNGKRGIANLYNGKVIVPLEYDYIEMLSEKKALLDKGSKNFLADITNGKVVPISDDKLWLEGDDDIRGRLLGARYDYFHYDEQSKSVIVEKNEKWGVVGLDGKVKAPIVYNVYICAYSPDNWEVRFCDGLLRVEKNGKCGYVDSKGKEVVPCKYDHAHIFFGGFAAVLKDGLWGFIDTKGKEITPFLFLGFDDVFLDNDLEEGLRNVMLLQGVYEDGKVKCIPGIVDCKGNTTFTEEEIKLAEKYAKDVPRME